MFPVDEATRVGQARRYAAQVADEAGFDAVTAGRLALVVTELGSNLVKHARGGKLLIALRVIGEHKEVEVLALDSGPGISDLGQSMDDGFSTVGTPGNGLGALERQADDFEIHSSVTSGTIVVARVRSASVGADLARQSAFRIGAVGICAPGESVCGDGWIAAFEGKKAAVLMVDGLGHGPGAEEAADAAVRTFAQQPFADPRSMLEATHAALRMTRGAALITALLDAAAGTIRYAGAGNVVMRVVTGVSDRTLLSQHGTAGLQLRKTEEMQAEWPTHGCIVFHTDGILTRWQAEVLRPLLGRDPALAASLLYRDYCRGRDDATVMVLRRKE